MPLAIELAAVRVRGLTVDQIATRLGDAFRLLASGPRAAPARHQTLRAAVDWSYELLSGAERALFNRLSVFVGGWTLEAAEIVCAGEAVQRDEIVQLLTRLVDRSLVVEAGFGAAFAAGRGLTLDQAVTVARTPDAADPATAGLTTRERDIARQVAQGLSNREIAGALVVSERTTESHPSHIFTKLGLRSRTQLATWAIERGLLASPTNPGPGGCP
jgi:predicted ATPase